MKPYTSDGIAVDDWALARVKEVPFFAWVFYSSKYCLFLLLILRLRRIFGCGRVWYYTKALWLLHLQLMNTPNRIFTQKTRSAHHYFLSNLHRNTQRLGVCCMTFLASSIRNEHWSRSSQHGTVNTEFQNLGLINYLKEKENYTELVKIILN